MLSIAGVGPGVCCVLLRLCYVCDKHDCARCLVLHVCSLLVVVGCCMILLIVLLFAGDVVMCCVLL